MKILNLIQCANLGGMEQASLRLMKGLKSRGHEVELLSLNPIGEMGPLLEDAGIPHEGLPYLGKGGWRSYGLLKRKLRGSNADALFMTGHNLMANLALGGFCHGRRILTLHFHHAGVKQNWQWNLIYRVACSRFNAITFPCQFIRDEAESIFPDVSHLAHIVRYPVEMSPLPSRAERMEARATLGLPLNCAVIGNGGWLIARKRFDVFLRVAREVLVRKPKAIFAIAGDGPDRPALESLVGELGITKNVLWLGWRKDMATFYKALDVVLFNSDWDAIGLTPLEAMSFGVPPVCSVINGGLGEIIDSDNVGFLRRTHDIGALTSLTLRLLNDPQEAKTVGLAGRRRVEEIGRIEPIVKWHEQVLLGNGHQGLKPNGVASVGKRRASSHRVAVIFHRIGPYHFARLRSTGQRVQTTAIEMYRLEDTYAWDVLEGNDGFKRVTLFESNKTQIPDTANVVRRVWRSLSECKPTEVVVPGWFGVEALAALQWCLQSGTPAVVMSESTRWDERRQVWKEWVKGRIVRLCSAALVGGAPQAEYLAALGMPRDRIAIGYDAVDNEHFAEGAADSRRQTSEFRIQHRLPEKYFLASMRFVEKKNAPRLLQAYALYRKKSEARSRGSEVGSPMSDLGPRTSDLRPPTSDLWNLVLLGDGPLKSDVCRLISDLGLQDHVMLPGFKQYGELPTYYGLASAFVHASTTEQWGLVVNEAMASNLPVLVSRRCGCASDLVHEGRNGFTFDPFDVDSLAELMVRISSLPPQEMIAMGQASSRIIADWGPERFANGLCEAVEVASSAPAPRASQFDRLLLKALLERGSR